MSLVAMTGFDHDVYGSRYGAIATGSIVSPGRFGRGRYLRFTNGNSYLDFNFFPAEYHNSIVTGFACWEHLNTYVDLAYQSSFIRLFGDAGQDHISIYWTQPAAGQRAIRVRRGDGTILATSSPILIPNSGATWRYFEFKVTIDDTAGEVVVRRDGVPVINLTGVDTRNGGTAANIHSMRYGQNSDNNYGSLDDIYLIRNDGTGLTDFMGEIEVEALLPNGNGNYSQLVGSDGNSTDNYLLVDDGPGVSDADYAGSATDGAIDTYTMGNLIRTSTTVHAVQLGFRTRKSDTTAKSVRRIIRSGGIDHTGADIPLASSFAWNREVLEQNPITSANWTQSDIDGLETGVEVRP